jgi:hypothetical protein
MPDLQVLTQANQALSKCGRRQYDAGQTAVLIPKSFLIQSTFQANPNQATQTIVKEITGEAPWILRAISATSSSTTGLSLQIKLPNGKFLISNLQDVLQFAGYGSYRYLFSKDLECPPGSQIQLTVADTNTGIAQSFAILFEGAYKYSLKGVTGGPRASNIPPRVLGTPNQNILAPCWMQGFGPSTPEGCEDMEYIYTSSNPSGVIAAPVALASPNATLQIQIDQNTDFICRRLLVDVTADDTVSTLGAFQVRGRAGSGYELSDDYIDIAQYLGSAQWVKDWHIPAADQVFFDVSLTDAVGTGNMYLTVRLEGVKRRKK